MKLIPAASIVIAIRGRVNSKSDLRPKLSMLQIAGKAPMKLTKPNTQEATNAPKVENPASAKI